MRAPNVAEVRYDAICDECSFAIAEDDYVRWIECAGQSCKCGADAWHWQRVLPLDNIGDPQRAA